MLRILFLSFNSIFSLGVPIAAVGGPRSSVDSIESHVNRRFLDQSKFRFLSAFPALNFAGIYATEFSWTACHTHRGKMWKEPKKKKGPQKKGKKTRKTGRLRSNTPKRAIPWQYARVQGWKDIHECIQRSKPTKP